MPEEFASSFSETTEVGMELHSLHSPTKDLVCSGYGRNFKKDSDFRRHWRVPIPCEVPTCNRTFRDDKLRAYLNHHASEHHKDGPTQLTQARLESYFRGMGKQLRHSFVPNLCVNKLGTSPKSNVSYSGNMPGSTIVSSTEPYSGFSSYNTVHTDVSIPLPSLSAPATSIGSSHLARSMNGFLPSPGVSPPNSQLAQHGTGCDCGRAEVQPFRPDGPGSYLKEQISKWKKSLSTKRHHSAYLQRLLASNLTEEQFLVDKINVAEEELEKNLHTKEPELQAPCSHQSAWDTFILDPALDN